MSATFKNLMLVLAGVLALTGGYWAAQSLRPAGKSNTGLTYEGGQMIDFTLSDLDDKKRSLTEWRGKVIVLNFWATWCPPCREEIPLFIAMQKQYAADGLQIIGVAIDTKTAVMVYRQSANINYPLLLGNEDQVMQLMARYGNGMGSLPFTVIMDRGGQFAVRKLGAFSRDELKYVLEPLLTPPKSS